MAEPTDRLWANAMHDARIIMGPIERRPLRGYVREHAMKADEDPLAWWCLVEILVAYAQGKKS